MPFRPDSRVVNVKSRVRTEKRMAMAWIGLPVVLDAIFLGLVDDNIQW